MHLQYYYQLRKDNARARPMITVDTGREKTYPLDETVQVGNQDELDTWVCDALASSKTLEPTTRVHLEIAHSKPKAGIQATTAAQWMLYAEAYSSQLSLRDRLGDRSEVLAPWREWLCDHVFTADDFPVSVKSYFEHCTDAGDILEALMRGPGVAWTAALMIQMNPSCRVDPMGESHTSGAVQSRAMANESSIGWTLSFKVTHFDSSEPIDFNTENANAANVKAIQCSAIARRDDSGTWTVSSEKKGIDPLDWIDEALLSMRHNKNIKRESLDEILNYAIAGGVARTAIIEKELPRIHLVGSGLSKLILERVLQQPWERIEREIFILDGLGYKDELPLYLYINSTQREPIVEIELPNLSV